MGQLYDSIRTAVEEERYLVGVHAEERCEERGVAVWQIVIGLTGGKLLSERPGSRPLPSVIVQETLPDGTAVEAIWSWLAVSRKAKLVTVYFRR